MLPQGLLAHRSLLLQTPKHCVNQLRCWRCDVQCGQPLHHLRGQVSRRRDRLDNRCRANNCPKKAEFQWAGCEGDNRDHGVQITDLHPTLIPIEIGEQHIKNDQRQIVSVRPDDIKPAQPIGRDLYRPGRLLLRDCVEGGYDLGGRGRIIFDDYNIWHDDTRESLGKSVAYATRGWICYGKLMV